MKTITVEAKNKAGEVTVPAFDMEVPSTFLEAGEVLGEERALKMIIHVLKIEARAKKNPSKKGKGTGAPKGTIGKSTKAVKEALKSKGVTEEELMEFIRAKRAAKGLPVE